MRNTHLADEQARLDFVKEAGKWFEDHPDDFSYGPLEPGNLLAMRWGLGMDCVLVLKLDDYFEPIVYGQAIDGEALTVRRKSYGWPTEKAPPRQPDD